MRKTVYDLFEYISISAGMGLAASCYLVLGLICRSASVLETILAIVIAALLCVAFAFAIGEMSSRYPSAPGIRTYLKKAFGEKTSLFFTYMALAIIPVFAGIELKTFINAILPVASPLLQLAVAALIIVALAVSNVRGKNLPMLIQMMIFALLLLAMAFMSSAALNTTGGGSPGSSLSIPVILSAAGMSIFLFMGFEWVTPTAKDLHGARRLIPIGMPVSIVILAVVYLAFALGLKLALPNSVLDTSPIPHISLGERIFHEPGIVLMKSVSFLAMLTTLNAGVIGTSRLVYGLAREKVLARPLNALFSATNEQGISTGSVLAISALSYAVCALLISTDLTDMLVRASAGLYCLIYAAFAAAQVQMRKRDEREAPFRNPLPSWIYYGLVPLITALGIASLVEPHQFSLYPVSAFGAALIVCAIATSKVVGARKAVSFSA